MAESAVTSTTRSFTQPTILTGANTNMDRNVHYSDITMTGCDSPFQLYIGARLLHPPGVPSDVPGSIQVSRLSCLRAATVYGFNTCEVMSECVGYLDAEMNGLLLNALLSVSE